MKTLKEDDIFQTNNTNISIRELLEENKRLISFLGYRQSGTTFLINNIALILAKRNIDVAILDMTSNKALYYIFTQNKEFIREDIKDCLKNISEGNPKGINVENNLTIYTDLHREYENNLKVEKILEVLLKKHQIVIVDSDFSTDISFFKYSQQIYLVQTMDFLTITPLTKFLSKLKTNNAINNEKVRIILNKFLDLEEISIKDLIGGLAFYNDSSMMYMQQLFEKNGLRYTTIPYNQLVYEIYVQDTIRYKVSVDKYPEDFRQYLEKLADDIITGY